MTDLPTFVAVGTIRCCAPRENRVPAVCGKPARWVRRTAGDQIPSFACDEHRAVGDTELAGLQLVRRVVVTAEVLMCGTSDQDTVARAEALQQLEDAVERAGGYLNLVDVRSQIGRLLVPAPPPRRPRQRGDTAG